MCKLKVAVCYPYGKILLQPANGRNLDQMEQERIVECMDWAAGIVVLSKKDGVFQVCGDYKVTMDQALAVAQ